MMKLIIKENINGNVMDLVKISNLNYIFFNYIENYYSKTPILWNMLKSNE
jgi:hypothetical protein